MSIRLTVSILIALVMLFTALSTGSAPLLLGGVVLLLLMITGWLSITMAERTIRIHTLMAGQSVRRGENVSMTLEVQHGGFLPIAPIV